MYMQAYDGFILVEEVKVASQKSRLFRHLVPIILGLGWHVNLDDGVQNLLTEFIRDIQFGEVNCMLSVGADGHLFAPIPIPLSFNIDEVVALREFSLAIDISLRLQLVCNTLNNLAGVDVYLGNHEAN